MFHEDRRRLSVGREDGTPDSRDEEDTLPEPLPENATALPVPERGRQHIAADISITIPETPSSMSFAGNGVSATLRRRTPHTSTSSTGLNGPTTAAPATQPSSHPTTSTPPPTAHGPTRSMDDQSMEVTFSPTSSRLYRQHSFTALQNCCSPRAERLRMPRTRSLNRFSEGFSEDAESQAAHSVHGHVRTESGEGGSIYSLREVSRPAWHARTVSGAEMSTPVSPKRTLVHSPVSGLYVPVPEPKNYYLSPVAPPFMPTARNHSFFDNILSSSSSMSDLNDSVCSQCPHTRTSHAPRIREGTLPPSENDDPAPGETLAVQTSDAPKALRSTGVPRLHRQRRVYPVIENIEDDARKNTDEHSTQAETHIAPGSGCCTHRQMPCGKRCRLAPSSGKPLTDVSREAKEEAFELAKDKMLRKSNVYSYNLVAMGLDETQPLFRFEEVPEWQRYNFFIKGSYRSYYTTHMTLKSMLGWHNETINVWSHFAGFVAFVILTIVLFATTLSTLVSVQTMSLTRLTYAFFCFGSILCMFNSAMYHLFTGHRKLKIFTLMGRLDFLGITILIVASFMPPLYVMFHCNTGFRAFYISLICLLGFAGIVGPWTRAFHEFVWLRTVVYVGMAISGFVPALHSIYLYPIGRLSDNFFTSQTYGIILMFLLYGAGVVFYATQFPESKFPGQFDTFLSSHQLWHFFVLMAAMVHFCNVVSMYQVWQLTDGVC